MKLPRLITRRRVKWAGAVLSVLIVVGLVASVFVRIHVIRFIAENPLYVRVDLMAGGIQVFWMNWKPRHEMPDLWEWNAEVETGWMP